MERGTKESAERLLEKRKRRRRWKRTVGVLAAAVVFGTAYALILPAIALTDAGCGMEEHTHGESCYEEQTVSKLICTLEEGEGHAHTEECYETALSCGLEENEEHSHTEECEENALICGLEESEGHVHGESCYEVQKEQVLICGKEEHTHTEECSIAPEEEKEPVEEEKEQEEPAVSDEDPEQEYLCVRKAHVHTEECYETSADGTERTLICGLEEHTHGEECIPSAETAYIYEDETISVTVTLPEGHTAMKNATLSVVPITEDHTDYDSAGQAVAFALTGGHETEENEAPASDRAIVGIHPFRFSLTDEEGNEIPLETGATVDVTFAEPLREQGEYPSGWSVFEKAGEEAAELSDVVVKRSVEEGARVVTGFTYRTDALADVTLAETTGIMTLLGTSSDTVTQVTDIDVTQLDGKSFYIGTNIDNDGNVCVMSGNSQITGYSPASILFCTSSTEYVEWTFEHVAGEDDNIYFIHRDGQYLKMEPFSSYAGYGNLTMVNRKEATPFTVTKDAGKGIQVKCIQNEKEYFLCFPIGAFAGSTEDALFGSSSTVYLYTPVVFSTVEGVNHPGTVINLFDYWIREEGESDHDTAEKLYDYANVQNEGINQNHDLKFYSHHDNKVVGINEPHTDGTVVQGIVANTLGTDGYPVRSGENGESLGYLFDPQSTAAEANRKVYRNVDGLLQIDREGYFYYDCRQNFAEYNADKNSFLLYEKPGAIGSDGELDGQFFPHNEMSKVAFASPIGAGMNHYFGLTLTTRFIQQTDGKTYTGKDTTFEFSGDDDVWIFIDDVLVADLGGIHGAASVKINFATGDVVINESEESYKKESTIKAAFTDAGKANDDAAWKGDTFADNSIHVMKFFYLERGGNASNLRLKYNLTEIPATTISKVNQYGDAVSGAGFAIYKTKVEDGEWKYIINEAGDAISLSANAQTDPKTGIITDDQTIINPLFTDVSDSRGEMVFTDDEGMPLTLEEIKEKYGEQFILREISVPPGYRMVSDEIHLRFKEVSGDGGSSINTVLLLVDNTQESGAWAAGNLLVTATQKLYTSGHDTVEYYQAGDGETKPNGTLFGVVFKYIGPTTGTVDDIGMQQNWAPVYGSDAKGYRVESWEPGTTSEETAKAAISAAISAAKKAQEYGDVVFSLSGSGTMQLYLTNLPGDIQTYSRLVNNDERSRFTVGYYWTSVDSLENATAENTWRVYTDEADYNSVEGQAPENYSPFTRTFGASIEVPNLTNRMAVQKLDQEGNYVNGAAFAMYRVEENSDGIFYKALTADKTETLIYLEKDTDGDNRGEAWLQNAPVTKGSYEVNSSNGEITVTIGGTAYTISPAENGKGEPLFEVTIGKEEKENDLKEDGTLDFIYMTSGSYYIREVGAPEGYRLNPKEVMLYVTDNAIYANAGTADDGVVVARGPGYLSATLQQFAAVGNIDNSLSWIYTQLKISDESNSFGDVNSKDYYDSWKYMTEQYAKSFDDDAVAKEVLKPLTVYLEYNPDSDNALFNYMLNDAEISDDIKNEISNNVSNTNRRLYTDIGWSYLEIYQNSPYGTKESKENRANYTEWSEDLSHLFSRSVYVQVTDEQILQDLTVKKVDSEKGAPLDGAQFVFYKMDGEEKLYYQYKSGTEAESEAVSWVKETDLTSDSKTDLTSVLLTTASNSTEKGIVTLKDIPMGTYYLQEIKAPDGYKITGDGLAKVSVKEGEILISAADGNASLGHVTVEGLKITVKNAAGYELPATGGSGTAIYYCAGILLLLTAGICGLYVKKKQMHF